MADAAVILAFGEGFEADDIQMHEDLVRAFDTRPAIHSFVLRCVADVAAMAACAAGYARVVLWNNYWPVDGIAEAMAQRFADALVGSSLKVTRLTALKSSTYRRLAEAGLATAWYRVVSGMPALSSLDPVPFPVIVKPDAGYDTVDMGETSLCPDRAALDREVARLAQAGHHEIIVQRFLAGREFTVPYGNRQAFSPVEKVYPAGRPFYLSGQPYEKRRCNEAGLEQAVRALARRAADAFGLAAMEYCRIDIRQDAADGTLYVIDMNDMCSIYPGGQFEAGLAADGLPRTAIAGWLTAPLALDRG